MKKKFDLRRAAAFLLCLLLCGAALPRNASAARLEEITGDCSLTLVYVDRDLEPDQPITGVEFRLYRVADITSAGKFRPLEAYQSVDSKASWTDKAKTLAGMVANATPEYSGTTGEDGKIVFETVEQGLYLVMGDTKTQGGYIYTPTAYLLSLPNVVIDTEKQEYSWEANVESHVKPGRRPVGGGDRDPDPIQRHVKKVWDDKGNEENRPQSVEVDLLRNGRVYDTVTLSADNNWRYDWTGLDADADWQIAEHPVAGYTVSVSQSGITFVITNTARKTTPTPTRGPGETPPPEGSTPPAPGETPPPEEEDLEDWEPPLSDFPNEELDIPDGDVPLDDLPQTGQLWWPVPVLTMAGLLLVFLGFMQRRRWSIEDEE